MKLLFKISLAVILFLLILVVLYIISLSRVKLEGVGINKLDEISLEGFTLSGDVRLYNGGLLPVKVKSISYEVTLESTGEQIAKADIAGRWISPKNSAKYEFETKIYWKATKDMILNILKERKTKAQIKGTVYVGWLDIEFMKEIDLEEYLKQFAKEKLGETVKAAVGTIAGAVKKYI